VASEEGSRVGPTLRTARLVLRPFRPEDVADVAAYLSDPEWGRYLGPDFPDPAAFVANNTRLDWSRECGLVIEHQGAVVGSVHLGREGREPVAELACLIAPLHQRKGFAVEACAAVVAYAFRELGVEQVTARADARNAASIRAMETLGMAAEERRTGGRVDRSRQRVDEVVYRLCR
jgi:RimJ/RimL family protein N-acetyltransferase